MILPGMFANPIVSRLAVASLRNQRLKWQVQQKKFVRCTPTIGRYFLVRPHSPWFASLLFVLRSCEPREVQRAQPSSVVTSHSDSSLVARWAGCYRWTFSRWTPHDLRGNSPAPFLPPALQLTADAGVDDKREVRPVVGFSGSEDWARSSSWFPISDDALDVIWSSGFGGIEMVVRRIGDRIVGRAEFGTDVVWGDEIYPVADVVGERVPCTLTPTSPLRDSCLP